MKKANKILFGEAIFTATDKKGKTVPGGVAIAGDEILAVGSRDEIEAYCTPDTEVYEFGSDALIMPGINDSHMHISLAFSEYVGVTLRDADSPEECVRRCVEWEKENSHYEWVYGYGWSFTSWEKPEPPTNELLNEAFPDKPVCLVDLDAHNLWLNDVALRRYGMTKDLPDPENTVVARYPDGTPTGYVSEGVIMDITADASASLEASAKEMEANVKKLLAEYNSYGLTSVAEMLECPENWLAILKKLMDAGEMTCRLIFVEDYYPDNFVERGNDYEKRFPDIKSDVWFYGFKLFYDGVGIAYTGWQVNPYNDRPDWCGEPVLPKEVLKAKTQEAIRSGRHVHIHCTGDMAVRYALDQWEEALNNGWTKPGQRFAITHNDTAQACDIERFAKLGVIASLQPDMLAPYPKYENNLYPSRYGDELMKTAWAVKSFFDSGAMVSFSTDTPVSLIDPMRQVYRAVTRCHDDGLPEGGLVPEQKISLSEALWAYTYGSAYQLGKEDFLGTLEPGKKADIAVLDKNLFAVDPSEYIGTKARMTIKNGDIVYKK